MKSQAIFLGLLATIQTSSAFRYNPWGEPMCAGAPDGGGTIKLGDACNTIGVSLFPYADEWLFLAVLTR